MWYAVRHRHLPTAPWVLRTEMGGERPTAQANADKLRELGYEAEVVELRVVNDDHAWLDGDGI